MPTTVFADWISCLRDEARLTLQVPEYALGGAPQTIDVPSEWLWELKVDGDHRLAVGREQGFLHISPAGYAANREAIIEAWVKGCAKIDRGYVAEASTFDAFAADFFAEVKGRSLWRASRGSCTPNKAKALTAALATYFS